MVEIHSAACSCWHRQQQSAKVPSRKRTGRVYGASYQSNMRRNDTIQSLARIVSFLCDQNPDKTCSTSSRSGADSKRVTNSLDLAVATQSCLRMQETASGMSALHSVAAAQFSPASRPQARTAPGRKCVCVCGMQPASVLSALHSVASAQLSPASRPRAKAAPGRKCVCVWNVTGRQKKDIKHAKIKHAETRGTKKHAGRTTSLHANDET